MNSKPNHQPNSPRLINSAYLAGARFLYGKDYSGLKRNLDDFAARELRPLAENQQRQWDALLGVLRNAYDSTPFYRERFDQAGVRPGDIHSPVDLQKIPPLLREDLRVRHDDLWSRCYARESLREAATGGTTDTPVPILRSPEAIEKRLAVHMRFNNWAGLWPGDKIFYLWGAQSDYAQNPTWRWRFYDRYLMRRVWAPTSLFNEQVMESHLRLLNGFRPRIIYAYPTPLSLFCEYLRSTGKTFHRPHSAICTAEPLLASQRKLIEEVLGCPLFEMYGSREFGMIAADCECHQGLHLNPFTAYIEFLPLPGADTEGMCEILVTDLSNHSMPLIRYRINDCAFPSDQPCACGRGYPLVRQFTGRTGDVFLLPNGDRVPGVALTNRVLKVCPGLKKVQLIQETLKNFRVRYVPGPSFSSQDLDLLRQNLTKFFPSGLAWQFDQVMDIERERSGKTRFCISRVTPGAAPSPLAVEGRR
jgi:phenylacetate-coenzyme A ligase PaaK-like adenylate-forming protein